MGSDRYLASHQRAEQLHDLHDDDTVRIPLTPDARAHWADEFLRKQGDKPAWQWDTIPHGLTTEDIAAARRRIADPARAVVADVDPDPFGRVRCAFCGGPLQVLRWGELLDLVEEADAEADRRTGSAFGLLIVMLYGVACGVIGTLMVLVIGGWL